MTKSYHNKIKGKAWDEFSIWVRNRDKRCVTCGKTFYEHGEYTIKGLQAGHYHHATLDFDEQNINAQCTQCNHFKSGNATEYTLYLIRKYGKNIIEKLDKKRQIDKVFFHSTEWYEDKYKHYKRLNLLKKW